jgi:hypothetical protein
VNTETISRKKNEDYQRFTLNPGNKDTILHKQSTGGCVRLAPATSSHRLQATSSFFNHRVVAQNVFKLKLFKGLEPRSLAGGDRGRRPESAVNRGGGRLGRRTGDGVPVDLRGCRRTPWMRPVDAKLLVMSVCSGLTPG